MTDIPDGVVEIAEGRGWRCFVAAEPRYWVSVQPEDGEWRCADVFGNEDRQRFDDLAREVAREKCAEMAEFARWVMRRYGTRISAAFAAGLSACLVVTATL